MGPSGPESRVLDTGRLRPGPRPEILIWLGPGPARFWKKPARTASNQHVYFSATPTPPVFAKKSKPKDSEKKKDDFIVHEKKKDDFIVHSVKSYPDLPVPQTEGIDKEKQYKDEIAEAKKRLEEARQRKMLEIQRTKDAKKRRKSSTSTTPTPKAEPVVKETKEDIKR